MDVERLVQDIIPNSREYIVGLADLTGLLVDKYKGHDFGIVIGKKLDDEIIDSIISGPNIEYLDLYNKTNRHLSELSEEISTALKTFNISSMAIGPTHEYGENEDRDDRNLRSDFSHKMAATRAGIGWIGKTDLLVSKKFGPRLRLVTILVDRPLRSSFAPINESKCGDCDLCVESCPAEAANGKSWNINIDRDEFYDPFKCMEKCIELCRQRMNRSATICGICVSVCPIGNPNYGMNL